MKKDNRHCRICLQSGLPEGSDYHKKCIHTLFGSGSIPDLEFGMDEVEKLAKKVIRSRVTIPGVQTKLSVDIRKSADHASKFTLVGLWGRFILKPPTAKWPELPADEHYTMAMAKKMGVETVPFGLINFPGGEPAYITRRVDRLQDNSKLAMEDMCQLTGRLTEDKYKGSHEQIAQIIKNWSANPVFDLVRFFDLVMFSFISGNSDMHLKNFSLLEDPVAGWKLAPSYDLLSTRLLITAADDPEELALTLVGKKSRFRKKDFIEFGKKIGMKEKQIKNRLQRLVKQKDTLVSIIEASQLSVELQYQYKEIVDERIGRIKKSL